jgi:type VI secretion system protein ImpL
MYWVTGVILLIYLVLVYLLGRWLPLHGSDVWILRGVLAFLGLIGAFVAFWYQYKVKKAKEASGEEGAQESSTDDLDALVREAVRRLKQSTLGRGTDLSSLPIVFVLGESGATKTTVLIHSALDPELLAGHVYRDNEVLPTSTANLWYTRQAIFVDPAGAMMAQRERWRRLVKLLQPARFSAAVGKKAQAPRAAIVCFDCETFLRQGAGEVTVSAARRLSARLQEVSQLLGISFPVYVLFTRLDRISFFNEFVRGMSKDEASEVLGATLPIRSLSAGVYADQETQRLTKAFDEIFYSLAERRIVLLPRENDGDRLPGIYEFPRELKKLRSLLVQFMVDLLRPSQLGTNPFLRGFYFTGVRPVVVDDVVAAPVLVAETAEESLNSGATQIFRGGVSQVAAPPAIRGGGPRRMPQWVFLTSLFNDILVKDRVALAASGSSSHVNLLRRIGLAFAVFLGLVFLTGFTVSFFQNHALQSRVRDEVTDLRTLQTPADVRQPASIGDLQKLDRLRSDLVDLSDWEENGAPWSMRWGLYSGHELYEDAMPFYFDRFNRLLFTDTQKRVTESMLALPDSPPANVLNDPQSNDLYGKTYNQLKAYLITTSVTPNKCYDQGKVAFLTQVLANRWAAERGIDKDRQDLAARQFDFYATELVRKNWLVAGNSATLVSHTRGYLKGFVGTNLLYARLKANVPDPAARSFNERYERSGEIIESEHRVAGAFTRAGYAAVQNALLHPSDIGADECVMGSTAALGLDPLSIQHQLTQMYNDEFVKEWNTVLKTSRFRGFKGDWADADTKLQKLTDPGSPQMELLYFISHNVNPAPAEVKTPFKAVQQLEDPAPTDSDTPPDKYLGAATSKYIDAIGALDAAVHALAQNPSDQTLLAPASDAAAKARQAAGSISSSLPLDHSQTPGNEQQVSRLLTEPIKGIEDMVRLGPVAAANKGAASFCGLFAAATLNKFPFNSSALQEVSIDQLNAIFGDGFTKFADSEKQFVLKSGNQYVANPVAPLPPSKAFLQSLTTFSRINETLYPPGATSPKMSYTLKVLSSNLEGVELKIGDKKLAGTGNQETFAWTGAPDVISVEKNGDPVDTVPAGPWAVFRFISHAKHITSNDWQWVIENNGRVVMLAPNKQKSYDYQLQVSGPANPFTDFPGMRCVGKVSQ